jgi:hypothetical protein
LLVRPSSCSPTAQARSVRVYGHRFKALIGWVICDHPPTLFVFMGMALVIGGGLVAISGKTDVSPAVVES